MKLRREEKREKGEKEKTEKKLVKINLGRKKDEKGEKRVSYKYISMNILTNLSLKLLKH